MTQKYDGTNIAHVNNELEGKFSSVYDRQNRSTNKAYTQGKKNNLKGASTLRV